MPFAFAPGCACDKAARARAARQEQQRKRAKEEVIQRHWHRSEHKQARDMHRCLCVSSCHLVSC